MGGGRAQSQRGSRPSEPGCSSPVPVGPLPLVWLPEGLLHVGLGALVERLCLSLLSRQPWVHGRHLPTTLPDLDSRPPLGGPGSWGLLWVPTAEARLSAHRRCLPGGADCGGGRSHCQVGRPGGEPGTAPGLAWQKTRAPCVLSRAQSAGLQI